MSADDRMQSPRDFLLHPDPWVRRSALSEIARSPTQNDRETLESYLVNSDPMLALLAFLGLKNLYRLSPSIDNTWRGLFDETTAVLEKRAAVGPLAMRLAAMQALAFVPGNISDGLIKRLLADSNDFKHHRVLQGYESQTLPLIRESYWSGDWAASMALVLTNLPLQSRISYIAQLLSKGASGEELQALPALLSLQLLPIYELTENILPLIRSNSSRIAIEAVRALVLCGGKRTYHLLFTLITNAFDSIQKAFLLPLLVQTQNPGTLKILATELRNPDPRVRKAAVSCIGELPIPVRERVVILKQCLNDGEALVAAETARVLSILGASEGMVKLEEMLRSRVTVYREAAAIAMGGLAAETAILPLLELLVRENSQSVLRAAFLSLRRLFSQAAHISTMKAKTIDALRHMFSVSSPFLCSQLAVLAGSLGSAAEELLMEELLKQRHPHVIASLLGAFRHIEPSSTLVLTQYSNNGDSRIRANLMEALSNGNSAGLPYLINGLRDPSPRVQAAAAEALFKMGRLDTASFLTRMLMIPSPASVTAACRALGILMRFRPAEASLQPLTSALFGETRQRLYSNSSIPFTLRDATLPILFSKLSKTVKNPHASLEILNQHLKSYPESYAAKRLTASFLTGLDNSEAALKLLEVCLVEHSGILADLLDAYRLAARMGDFVRTERFGAKLHNIYEKLFDACTRLTHTLGKDSPEFVKKFDSLKKPSMNLYSAMIQLKATQGDDEIVLELLAELLLARPGNHTVVFALASKLPKTAADLKLALLEYAGAAAQNANNCKA